MEFGRDYLDNAKTRYNVLDNLMAEARKLQKMFVADISELLDDGSHEIDCALADLQDTLDDAITDLKIAINRSAEEVLHEAEYVAHGGRF